MSEYRDTPGDAVAPPVGPAATGRVYYDSVSNTFKVSNSGAAYDDLAGPPLSAAPPVNVTKSAALVGVSTDAARSDHKHDVTTAAPSTIGTANSEGAATSVARSDHVHDHGAQTSGTLHAAVIAAGASGFMTGADKTKLDGITAEAAPAVLGWGNSGVAATTTTRYLTPWYEDAIAPTAAVQYRVPRAGKLRKMRVHATGAGNGSAIVYTLRVNSVASALTVSMASTAADGSDLVNSVTVAAGDLVDIEVTKAASVGATPAEITATMEFSA